jgi:hypothetical protein
MPALSVSRTELTPCGHVMVVFILYLGKMYKPRQEISKMTDTYLKAAVGYERLREISGILHRIP